MHTDHCVTVVRSVTTQAAGAATATTGRDVVGYCIVLAAMLCMQS